MNNTLLHRFLELQLTQEIKDILVGTILGDARINFSNYLSKASFYFEQGLVHKEYLYFIFGYLCQYATSDKPQHRKYVDKRSGKETESYFFSLKSSRVFRVFAQMFYHPKDGRYLKKIPWECIWDILTPRALAFWIIDDGQYVKRGGITLCTDNYRFKDVFHLLLLLEMKYGLICSIHTKNYSNRSKVYYRIYISKTSLRLLRSIVAEHMHSSMRYKLYD